MLRLKVYRPYIPFLKRQYVTNANQTATSSEDFPKTASTVIIGGGVAGTSVAYHLAKQGSKNVILLEKSELTAGSTWHAAGLTTFYNGLPNLKRLHWDSMNIYSQLETETDQEITFRQPGSLRLAFQPDRVKEFQRSMTTAGWQDAPQRLLTPKEVKEIVPFMKTDKLLMGLLTPFDGHVDPYSLTQALAKGARKYGARIIQRTPVTSLTLTDINQWVVGTSKGEITADRIVNAAGFWANDIAKLAGHWLPAIATHHQYIITSPLPEIEEMKWEIPVLRHMEGSSYIRQEKQGLLLGSYEEPQLVDQMENWFKNGVEPEFGKELFPSNLDRIMTCFSRVMEDLTIFETANIQSIINGPITYSPDGLPMIGQDELPNMWTIAAFGFGIAHGGGAGKYIADWIQNGEPPYELSDCDPLRYKAYADEKYSLAKARETYGCLNNIAYSNEERFAGRPTERLSSAYNKQLERRAHMQFHSGWEQPAWFALPGEKAEYIPSFERGNWHEPMRREWDTVTKKAGIIDLTPFAKFFVQGPQSSEFLDYITANKVPAVGKTVISHLLSPSAKVFAELTITQTEPNKFFVITGSGSEMHDLRWMKTYAREGKWKVDLINVTNDYGCLSVAGPNSKNVLEKLSKRFQEKFPFLTASEVILGDIKTIALRITYTGELGWELYHPRHQTEQLYEMLLDHGSDQGIDDFGTKTLNTLRIEKGFRMWGTEINMDRNLHEAGLLYFVNKQKKDYVGMAAQKKLEQTVPKQKLVMATVNGQPKCDPHGDESCWIAGKPIGKTTSGCYSFLLEKSLMFCYLPPTFSIPGIQFEGLLQRLDEGVVIGDGGFTFALEHRGYVKAGPCTPEATVEHPEAVLQLHREFLRAGSDVMQAFTFYASDDKLSDRGNKSSEKYTCSGINKAGCKLAKEVAQEGGALVAGGVSQTPTYLTGASKAAVQKEFQVQIDAFVSSEVDFVVAEYFEHIEEIEWAIEALAKTGLPVVSTMVIGPEGDMNGVSAGECGVRMVKAGADVVGINCHFDPFIGLKTIKLMKEAIEKESLRAHYITQPLAYLTPDASRQGFIGLPEFPYALEPRLCTRFDIYRYAREAYELGVRYIGGCCGFEPYHIRAISEELQAERGGKLPKASEKHEQWGTALKMHTKPWVRARACKEHWKSLNPSFGRPYSAAMSRSEDWEISPGDDLLK